MLELQPDNIHVRHQMRRLTSVMVPFWHIPMLNDIRRNDAFERAICKAVEKEGPDARILDIGTGSGLLSMMAARAGARSLAGPIYSPVGKTWAMSSTERRTVVTRLVENLRPLADYAGERGITLALEPLNRFETSFMNTAEQVMEVVDRVSSPALGVLLDTFHMNIEERDPAAAIRACGSHLAHFHACGCDRGAPGGDQISWPKIAAALRVARYEGPIVIESFTIENQAIARAAAIWRPLAPTQDSIAIDGLKFLRALLS